MVQRLGTSATLAEYSSLIPSTHICQLTIACNSSSGGSDTSGLHGHLNSHAHAHLNSCAHTHMHIFTHAYTRTYTYAHVLTHTI